MAVVKSITTVSVTISKEDIEKLQEITELIDSIEIDLEHHNKELDDDDVQWEGYNQEDYDIGSILWSIRQSIGELMDARKN